MYWQDLRPFGRLQEESTILHLPVDQATHFHCSWSSSVFKQQWPVFFPILQHSDDDPSASFFPFEASWLHWAYPNNSGYHYVKAFSAIFSSSICDVNLLLPCHMIQIQVPRKRIGASLQGHYATYIVGNVFNPKISLGETSISMMLHLPRSENEVSDFTHVFKQYGLGNM